MTQFFVRCFEVFHADSATVHKAQLIALDLEYRVAEQICARINADDASVFHLLPKIGLRVDCYYLWDDMSDRPQLKSSLKRLVSFFQQRWVVNSLKVLMVVALMYSLYKQIYGRDDFDEIWAAFRGQLSGENIIFLVMTFVLLPINWAFETGKFHLLAQRFEKISYKRAYRGVLMGVTLSVFTPNRIGEYGGRMMVVQPGGRAKAAIVTIVGSLAQMIALLGFGVIGLVYLSISHLEMEAYVVYMLGFMGGLAVLLMLLAYFQIDLIVPIIRRIPYVRRFVDHVLFLKEYSSSELLRVLGFACLRYGVYTLQYYFLTQFFGIDVGFVQSIGTIAVIFLVQTSVPLPPVLGLLVRGEVALTLWALNGVNQVAILATTLTLWCINIVVPALVGMMFILLMDVVKTWKHEKADHQRASSRRNS